MRRGKINTLEEEPDGISLVLICNSVLNLIVSKSSLDLQKENKLKKQAQIVYGLY